MLIPKICPACGVEFCKSTKYCCAKCYFSAPVSKETRLKMSLASRGKKKTEAHRLNISLGTKGKPKPWVQGEKNPNFGGASHRKPGVLERLRKGSKLRGQAWNEGHRKAHSVRMLGPSNKMRGKTHSPESKKKISDAKKRQYALGLVKIKTPRVSRAEKEIEAYLLGANVDFRIQYSIPGVSYIYDFYFPGLNIILDYRGDYWHCNPEKYFTGELVSFPRGKKILVDDVWERDLDRVTKAEQSGITVKILWESDYKKERMGAVIRLLSK